MHIDAGFLVILSWLQIGNLWGAVNSANIQVILMHGKTENPSFDLYECSNHTLSFFKICSKVILFFHFIDDLIFEQFCFCWENLTIWFMSIT